jgi:ABC-type multidrug transport system ATPase subunit
LLTEN